MVKWWCLLARENYMFRPVAAIIRFWQLSCSYSKKVVKTWWWPPQAETCSFPLLITTIIYPHIYSRVFDRICLTLYPIQFSAPSCSLFTFNEVYIKLLLMYLLLDVAVKYTARLIRILEVLASYLYLPNGNSRSSSGNFWDRTSKYITTVSFHGLSNSSLAIRTLNDMHQNYWNCCPMNHTLHTNSSLHYTFVNS